MSDYTPNSFKEFQYADIDQLIEQVDIQTPPSDFEYQIMLDQYAQTVNPYTIPAVGNVAMPTPGKATSNFNPAIDYSKLNSEKSIDNYFQQLMTVEDPYKDMKIEPIRFGYKSVNFDRYAAHDNFNELGFHPYRDNERVYNANSTWYDDFTRAFRQMGKLAYTGFVSAYRSLGDLFDDDNSYIVGRDLDSAREFSEAIRIGETTRGGVGEFFTNLGLQFGYTGGIMLSIAAEEFALATLTRGFSLGTSGLRQGSKLKMLGEQILESTKNITPFRFVENSRDIATNMNNVDKAKGFWESVKAGENFLGKIVLPETMQTLRLLNTQKATVQNMSNMAKSFKTFGGFYRDLRSFNYALSEAKMEGGMNYDRGMESNLDAIYEKNNGAPITDQQFEDIKLNASARGAWTTGINAPIIYLSNQLLLGNAFGSWNRSFARYIKDTSNEIVDRIARNSPLGKKAGRNFIEIGKNTRMKKLAKLRAEGVGAFAKGSLKRTMGGSLRYFAANFSEGLQEVSQEATAEGVGAYYEAILDDPLKGGIDLAQASILTGISSQMNAQGFEVFMSGFLMGSIAKPVQKLVFDFVPNVKERIFNPEKYAEYEQEREKTIKLVQEALNEVFESGIQKDGDYFNIDKALVANFFAQKQVSEQLQSDVAEENTKAVHDSKDDSKFFQLYTVFESNTESLLRDQIKDYLSLSDNDLLTAIPSSKTEGVAKVRERLTSFLNTIDNFETLYGDNKNKFINPHNPSAFDKGTPEYQNELIAYNNYERFRRLAIFTDFNLGRQAERMANMFSDLESNELYKDMAANEITTLLTKKSLERELDLLGLEIASLDVEEQPQLMADKMVRLALLKSINDAIKVDDNNKIILDEATKDKLKVYIVKYIKELAKQRDQVQIKDLESTVQKIIDFYELSNEEKAYALTAQNLADTTIQTQTIERLSEIVKAKGISEFKTEDIKDAIVDYVDLQIFNKLLNELADLNIYPDPKQVVLFKSDNFNPEYLTVWLKDGKELLEDDPDYQTVINFKQIFRDAYNKKKTKKKAKEQEEVKKEEAKSEKKPLDKLKDTIGDDQFNVYANNIAKLIIDDLNIADDGKYIKLFYLIGADLYEASEASIEDFVALKFDMEAAINNLPEESKEKVDIDDQNIKDILAAQKTFEQATQEEQEEVSDQMVDAIANKLANNIELSAEEKRILDLEGVSLRVSASFNKISKKDTTEKITERDAPKKDLNDIERQKQLEDKVKELEKKDKQFREEDGTVLEENVEAWKQNKRDIQEAKDKARRGNLQSNEAVVIRKYVPDGDSIVLVGEEAKAAEQKIEAVIQDAIDGKMTAEQAIMLIISPNQMGFAFNLNEVGAIKDYINDRTSDAPEIGNNKAPFSIWRKGESVAQQTTEEVQDQREIIEPADGVDILQQPNSEYAAIDRGDDLYELVGVDENGYFKLSNELFGKGMLLEGKRFVSKDEYYNLFAKGDEKIRQESDYRNKIFTIEGQAYLFGTPIYMGNNKFAFITYDDDSETVEVIEYDKYEAFQNSKEETRIDDLLADTINVSLLQFGTMSKTNSQARAAAIAFDLQAESAPSLNKISNVTQETSIELTSDYEKLINELVNNGDLTAEVYATFRVVLEDTETPAGTKNLFQTEENEGNPKIKQTSTGKRLKFMVPQSLIDIISQKYKVDVGDVFGYINLDTLQFQTNTGALMDVNDMTLEDATDYFSTTLLKGDNAQEYFNLFKESHRAKKYLVNNIDRLEDREYTLDELVALMNMKVDTRTFSRVNFSDERVLVDDLPVNTYTNQEGEELTLVVKSTYNPTTNKFTRQKLQDNALVSTEDVDVDALDISHGYVLITNESPGGKITVRPLITKSIPQNELVEFLNEQLEAFKANNNTVQVNEAISDKIFIRSIAGAFYSLTINKEGQYLLSFSYETKDKTSTVEPVLITPQEGVITADQIQQAIIEMNEKTSQVSFAYNPQQRNLGSSLEINLKSFSRGFPKDANVLDIIENSETIGIEEDIQSVHLRLNDDIDQGLTDATQDKPVVVDRSDIQENNRNKLLKRKRELEDQIEALESVAEFGDISQEDALMIGVFKAELKQINEQLGEDDIAYKLVESEYTPEDVENLDRFIEYLDRILPPEMIQVVGLEDLAQRLIDNNVLVGAFRLQLEKVAEGMTVRGKIYTSKDSPFKYHEAFHAVFRMLLTPQELKQYYRIAKRELKNKLGSLYSTRLEEFINSTKRYKELSKKQVAEYGMSEAELRFLEEYMADEFDKFKMNPKSSKTDSFIKSLFNKILEIIKAIFTTSTKNELNTLFENIDAGKFRTRTNIDNRFTELAYRGDTEIIPALIPYNSKKKLTSDATSYVVGNVYANTVIEVFERGNRSPLSEIIDQQIQKLLERQEIVTRELYKELPLDTPAEISKSEELPYFVRAKKILDALKLDEGKKIIKEQVSDRLAQIKIQEDTIEEDFQEMNSNIGVKYAGTFTRNSEGIGGITSLPMYWRVLFSTTFYETKNQLGQTEMLPVEPAVVYDGFMAALVDIDGSLNKLRQLVVYADSGNAQTNAVVDRFLKTVNLTKEFITSTETTQQDLEDYINDPMSGITSEQKNILQKFMVTFDHTRNKRIVTKIDEKTGVAFAEDIAFSGAVKYQMDTWLDANTKKQGNMRNIGTDHLNEAIAKMRGIPKKGPRTNEKIITETLSQLYNLITSSKELYESTMSFFDSNKYTEYRALMNISTGISKNISEILGISISPMFIAYSVLKSGDTSKSSNYKLQSLVEGTDAFPIIADTVQQISDIINGNKTEGINVSLFDSIRGVRGRLRSIAASNALFDETVPATTLRNAEGSLIYAYQRKSLMSRFIAEINRTNGQNLKENQTEFLKNNYLLNSDDFMLMIETGQLEMELSEGVQDVDGMKVLGGSSYGNMKPTDFFAHLINLYMSSVDRLGVLKDPSLSFQTSKILLRVLESSSKGQIVPLPVIKGFENNKVSTEAMKAFISYVGAEMNRIQKVTIENSDQNIAYYNSLPVQNENTNEEEFIKTDGVVKDDKLVKPNGYTLFKTKDLINNENLVKALEGLASMSNEMLNEKLGTEGEVYDLNDYGTLIFVLDNITIDEVEGNVLTLLKDSINGTIEKSISDAVQIIEDNNLTDKINKFFLEGSNDDVNGALNLKKDNRTHNLGQFIVSNYINTFSFNNLLYGDAALSFKNVMDQVVRGKTASADFIPAYSEAINPELGITQQFKDFDLIPMSSSLVESLFTGDNIKDNDSILYMSTMATRYVENGIGRLDKFFADTITKIENNQRLSGAEVFDENGLVEKSQMLNPKKYVYADGQTLLKMSAITLTPELDTIPGTNEPDPARIVLYNLRMALEKYQRDTGRIAVLAPVDTIKKLKKNVQSFTALASGNLTIEQKNTTKLNAINFGLQQVNPSNKSEITSTTQILALLNTRQDPEAEIIVGGKEMKIGDVMKAFNESESNTVQMQHILKKNLSFTNALDVSKNLEADFTDQEVQSIAPFLAYAQNSLRASTTATQELEFLEFNPDGSVKYDVNNPIIISKIKDLLVSYFSKSVLKQKLPGTAFTLTPDMGIRIYRMVYSTREVTTKNGTFVVPDKSVVIRRDAYFADDQLRNQNIAFHIDMIGDVMSAKIGADSNLEGLMEAVENSQGKGVLIIDRLRYDQPEYIKEGDPSTWKATGQKKTEALMSLQNKETYNYFEKQKAKSVSQIESEYNKWKETPIADSRGLVYEPGSIKGYDENKGKKRFARIYSYRYKINEEGNVEFLPFTLSEIPKAISESMAVRIPSQAEHQAMAVEFVDFLPVYYGNAAAFSREMIEASGADFDIDTAYAHFYEYYFKNGAFLRYGEEGANEFEEYITYVNNIVKKRGNSFYDAAKFFNKGYLKTKTPVLDEYSEIGYSEDGLNAISVLGLPITKEQYNKFKESNGFVPNMAVLNNAKLTNKIRLLSNEGMNTETKYYIDADGTPVRSRVTPDGKTLKEGGTMAPIAYLQTSTQVSEAIWEAFRLTYGERWANSIYEKEQDVDNPISKFKSYEGMHEGVRSIGSGVLPNSILNLYEQLGIRLNERGDNIGAFKINGYTYYRYDTIKEVIKDGNTITYGRNTQDILDELISIMTDDKKLRLAARFNLNANSLAVVVNMVALGVPLKTAYLFFQNKMIRNIYSSTKSFDLKDAIRTKVAELEAQVGEEAAKSITGREITTEELSNTVDPSEDVSLENLKALKFLQHQMKLSEFNFHMGVVLSMQKGIRTFEQFNNIDASIQKMSKGFRSFDYQLLFKPSSRKDEPGVLKNTKYTYEQLPKTMYAKLFEVYEDQKNRIFPQMLITSSPGFVSFLDNVKKRFAFTRKATNEKLERDLLSYLTLKAYQHINVGNINLGDLTNTMLYPLGMNDRSVVGEIQRIVEERGLEKNLFISRFLTTLEIDDVNNFIGIEQLQASVPRGSEASKADLQNSFLELYNNPTTRDLANKVVHYLMVSQGLQASYNSIIGAISPVVIENYLEVIPTVFNTLRSTSARPSALDVGVEVDAPTYFKTFGATQEQLESEFIKYYFTSSYVFSNHLDQYTTIRDQVENRIFKMSREQALAEFPTSGKKSLIYIDDMSGDLIIDLYASDLPSAETQITFSGKIADYKADSQSINNVIGSVFGRVFSKANDEAATKGLPMFIVASEIDVNNQEEKVEPSLYMIESVVKLEDTNQKDFTDSNGLVTGTAFRYKKVDPRLSRNQWSLGEMFGSVENNEALTQKELDVIMTLIKEERKRRKKETTSSLKYTEGTDYTNVSPKVKTISLQLPEGKETQVADIILRLGERRLELDLLTDIFYEELLKGKPKQMSQLVELLDDVMKNTEELDVDEFIDILKCKF